MKGRKSKPTRLKVMSGNPGKRRLNDREPMPQRGRPKCPPFLHDYAKKEWALLIPELDRLGLLTIVDRAVLSAYCQAWAEFRLATEILAKEGRTAAASRGGLKTHPAVQMQRSAMEAIRNFGALFGLDPSSRSRLRVPEQTGSDPLDLFLGGKEAARVLPNSGACSGMLTAAHQEGTRVAVSSGWEQWVRDNEGRI